MRLRTGLLYFALMFGALAGVVMTPEEIEEAMSLENRSKIAYVVEEEDGEPLRERGANSVV
jgi:hypothetical protein